MHPEREQRRVIPLHGATSGEITGEVGAGGSAWDPARIVDAAPAPLRPLIVDLLSAAGADSEQLTQIRARLPERPSSQYTPDELGAAVGFVRSAVERAASAGASPEWVATRHACLDAAAVAWAEAALARRSNDQRRLLRDVSHDIRSPLNSILFLADALRSGHSGELTPTQKRQVDVLFMAAVTLVKLVNDLIDYAHLDDAASIQVDDSAFSPASVVGEVRGLLGPLLDYHGVELLLDERCGAPRRGDARLLNRVLLNLVSNATQAMSDGGRIEVTLADERDGQLRVVVEDDGPGVDVAALRASLEAALAGASLAETKGWTRGLGLSISARLVDAAGGTLQVENRAPAGTRFVVGLPFPRM